MWSGKTGRGRIGTFFRNDPTLIGYFQLSDSSFDNSGNGHPGTDTAIVYGKGSDRSPSPFTKVAKFNGTSSEITFGDNLNLGTGPFTVMLWMRANAVSGYPLLFGKTDYNGVSELDIRLKNSTGIVELNLFGVAASNIVTSTKDVNDARAHFIVGKRDGTNVELLIDGIKDGSTGDSAQNLTSTSPCKIGRFDGGSAWFMDGEIWEVAVFTRGVSDRDIMAYYRWATAQGVEDKSYMRVGLGIITSTLTETITMTEALLRSSARILTQTITLTETLTSGIIRNLVLTLETFSITDKLRVLWNGLFAGIYIKASKPTTSYTKETKPTTSFTKEDKPWLPL